MSRPNHRRLASDRARRWRRRSWAVWGALLALFVAIGLAETLAKANALLIGSTHVQISAQREAALYPHAGRKIIEKSEEAKYRGAGVLMCFTDMGTLERAAAAWLIGSRGLVVLNAHNFVDRSLRPSHPVENCFFRIRGVDRYFDEESLRLGVDGNSKSLHITDDWALGTAHRACSR